MDRLFAASRYKASDSEADYLNAAFSRDGYEAFIEALLAAERVQARDFESQDLFSACQPIEEVARSGRDALRFGALKPVGLQDPATGRRPWAAVQLRAENRERTAYNLVGFQTNLTFSAQEQVFRMIPGLAKARFARYGVMHRNTFIDCPHVLGRNLELPTRPHLRFAGQITGTEGYTEAIASGLFAALSAFAQLSGLPAPTLPGTSAFGALLAYATSPDTAGYQPMHVNYGIMPPLDRRLRSKQDRYRAYSDRAIAATRRFIEQRSELFA